MATDETENNKGVVRHDDFCSGRVEVIKDSMEAESNTFSHMEAGLNTSTVTLQVVVGDEKGSLESETVKYGHESQGTRTRKRLRWRGTAAIVNDRPVLSSERAHHINKPATV
jgi:hypothetical protein